MKVEALDYGERKVYSVSSFNRGIADWLSRLPTIWVDGTPTELPPVEFEEDLSGITGPDLELSFSAWAAREDRTNALLLKSRYRQPFGTFSGNLTPHVTLSEGYGVMEAHDVHW